MLARPAAVRASSPRRTWATSTRFALLERQAHVQHDRRCRSRGLRVLALRATDGDGPAASAPPRASEPKARGPRRADRARAVRRAPTCAASSPRPRAPPPARASQTSSDARCQRRVVRRAAARAGEPAREHPRRSARPLGAGRPPRAAHGREDGARRRATRPMLVAAAFIHDLGKMGQYHLTALNCSRVRRAQGRRAEGVRLPARLLEPVRLPAETIQPSTHMYERYDGKGFPDGHRRQGHPARRARARHLRHLRRPDAEPAQPVPQDAVAAGGVRRAREAQGARSSIRTSSICSATRCSARSSPRACSPTDRRRCSSTSIPRRRRCSSCG